MYTPCSHTRLDKRYFDNLNKSETFCFYIKMSLECTLYGIFLFVGIYQPQFRLRGNGFFSLFYLYIYLFAEKKEKLSCFTIQKSIDTKTT